MGEVQTVLDHLEQLGESRKFYIKLLRLWAHLEETTGLTHEEVRAFTFRPEHLTKYEKAENYLASRDRRPPVYCEKNWHNCVRLKDTGDIVPMPGIARPIPPEHMASKAEVVVGL